MIRGEHLHKEINDTKVVADEFEKEGRKFEATVLKCFNLILKMLLNIRQNQVQVMPPEKLAKNTKDNTNE